MSNFRNCQNNRGLGGYNSIDCSIKTKAGAFRQ